MVAIGRPRAFDRIAALGDAMRVFWRKGFASTSMTDLCEAMGIRSPSLYAAFGSKEELYLEAIDHYVMTVGSSLWEPLLKGETARAGVENLLLAAAEMLPEGEAVPAGCMAMLGGVSDEWPSAVALAANRVRLDSLEHLRSRLGAAVAAGELPSSTDVDGLSRFYLGVVQGMAIQAKDGSTAKDLRGIAETAMVAWPGRGDIV